MELKNSWEAVSGEFYKSFYKEPDSEARQDAQLMRQDTKKENVDEAVKNSNKRQAFCFVKSQAHDKPYKAGIENFMKSAVAWVH